MAGLSFTTALGRFPANSFEANGLEVGDDVALRDLTEVHELPGEVAEGDGFVASTAVNFGMTFDVDVGFTVVVSEYERRQIQGASVHGFLQWKYFSRPPRLYTKIVLLSSDTIYILNSITSPSFTMYSFPSVRTFPFSFADANEPEESRSSVCTTSALINLSLKSL